MMINRADFFETHLVLLQRCRAAILSDQSVGWEARVAALDADYRQTRALLDSPNPYIDSIVEALREVVLALEVEAAP